MNKYTAGLPAWLVRRGIAVVLVLLRVAQAESAAPTTKPTEPSDHRIQHLVHELHDSNSSTVMVVAHRAGWKYAPENSIEGIRKCIDMGVDMLEIDLHKTSDGHFVLMHDKTLDRTTNGAGLVANHTLAQIEELLLKDGQGKTTSERIPTLEQLVELSRGHILIYLDKTEDCIDEVYARLVELDAADFCVFYGERTPALLRSRYGRLVDHLAYLPKIYDSTPDMDRYIRDFGSDLHPAAFVIEFNTRDSQVLKEIPVMKSCRARVWASPLWPAAVAAHTDVLALKDPDANWGWMIERGVNMFCTDQPREMLAWLRAKGLHE